jgi:hypothetical protein
MATGVALAWAVLCDKTSVDLVTNNISLHDVVEQLTVEFPKLPPGARGFGVQCKPTLVCFWHRAKDGVGALRSFRTRFVSPDDEVLIQSNEQGVDLTSTAGNRTIMAFEGLPITRPGTYWFVVQARDGEAWNDLSRVPLQVVNRATSSVGTTEAEPKHKEPGRSTIKKTAKSRRAKRRKK